MEPLSCSAAATVSLLSRQAHHTSSVPFVGREGFVLRSDECGRRDVRLAEDHQKRRAIWRRASEVKEKGTVMFGVCLTERMLHCLIDRLLSWLTAITPSFFHHRQILFYQKIVRFLAPMEDSEHSPGEDAQVTGKAGVLQVVKLHLQLHRHDGFHISLFHLFCRQGRQYFFFIAKVERCLAGHAGANGKDTRCFFLNRGLAPKSSGLWPGTHKTHLTAQNIDELGQFIQLPLAHETPKASHPGIRSPDQHR